MPRARETVRFSPSTWRESRGEVGASRISPSPAMSTVEAPRLTPSTAAAGATGAALKMHATCTPMRTTPARAPQPLQARRSPEVAALVGVLSAVCPPSRDTARRPCGAAPRRACSGDALGLRTAPRSPSKGFPGRSSGGSHESGTCVGGCAGQTAERDNSRPVHVTMDGASAMHTCTSLRARPGRAPPRRPHLFLEHLLVAAAVRPLPIHPLAARVLAQRHRDTGAVEDPQRAAEQQGVRACGGREGMGHGTRGLAQGRHATCGRARPRPKGRLATMRQRASPVAVSRECRTNTCTSDWLCPSSCGRHAGRAAMAAARQPKHARMHTAL